MCHFLGELCCKARCTFLHGKSVGRDPVLGTQYSPEANEFLLFQGAEYEVLDDSQEHWWKVKDEHGYVIILLP